MKLAIVAIIIFTLLCSLVAGLQSVKIVEANFVPGPPGIFIVSPANKTYNSQSILLNMTIKTFFDHGNGDRIVEYSLDGKENVTVPTVYEGYDEDQFSTVTALVALPDLSEGTHNITVYATYHFPNYANYTTKESTTSIFTINYASPYISVLTPKTQEYNTADIPLTFTVDKPVSAISYKLDGKANVPINGNTTLTGLSDGAHRIVIYANDALGTVGISETVLFGIYTATPFQSPTSTAPLITPTHSSFPNTTILPSQTPSPTSKITINPSSSTSPLIQQPTPSLTPTITPTSTPTQQPTPLSSAIPYYGVDYTPRLIIIILVTLAVVVGLLVYFKKRR